MNDLPMTGKLGPVVWWLMGYQYIERARRIGESNGLFGASHEVVTMYLFKAFR